MTGPASAGRRLTAMTLTCARTIPVHRRWVAHVNNDRPCEDGNCARPRTSARRVHVRPGRQPTAMTETNVPKIPAIPLSGVSTFRQPGPATTKASAPRTILALMASVPAGALDCDDHDVRPTDAILPWDACTNSTMPRARTATCARMVTHAQWAHAYPVPRSFATMTTSAPTIRATVRPAALLPSTQWNVTTATSVPCRTPA